MKTVYRKDIRLSHMARLLRRSFACAPFSAGDLSGEVALVRMEEVRAPLVVKHGETGVRVADAGFFWLEAAPRARHWWLTAALDENGGIVQYYFDITLENDIRPGGQSSFLDLFLDVVLSPGGDVYILDRDELAAALSAGGGMKELEAQLLFSGSQHRPGLGVGHVHGERCRPQGMILLDPVQKLRNPRPEYLVICRIEADGHFEKHVTVHVFIVPVFSEMSMALAIKPR